MISLSNLEALRHSAPGVGTPADVLLPVETALDDIPALAVSDSEATDIRNGRSVRLLRKGDLDRVAALPKGCQLRVEAHGELVAIARIEANELKPERVLNS